MQIWKTFTLKNSRNIRKFPKKFNTMYLNVNFFHFFFLNFLMFLEFFNAKMTDNSRKFLH